MLLIGPLPSQCWAGPSCRGSSRDLVMFSISHHHSPLIKYHAQHWTPLTRSQTSSHHQFSHITEYSPPNVTTKNQNSKHTSSQQAPNTRIVHGGSQLTASSSGSAPADWWRESDIARMPRAAVRHLTTARWGRGGGAVGRREKDYG